MEINVCEKRLGPLAGRVMFRVAELVMLIALLVILAPV